MRPKMLAAVAGALETGDLHVFSATIQALVDSGGLVDPATLTILQALDEGELAVLQAIVDIRHFIDALGRQESFRGLPTHSLRTGLGESLSLECRVTAKGSMTVTIRSRYPEIGFPEAVFRRSTDPLMQNRGSAKAWAADWRDSLPRLLVDLVPFLHTQLTSHEEFVA